MIPWLPALSTAIMTLAIGYLWGSYNSDVYQERDDLRTTVKSLGQHITGLTTALLAEGRHRWDRGETMICQPCREAADMDQALGVPVSHDPATCRDHDIKPHGCACEHGVHLAERASP